MTSAELLRGCQEYYGLTYTPGQGRMIEQYLDTLRDDLKKYLFAAVLKKHSATYKSLPDIAIFEATVGTAWENLIEAKPKAPALTHDDGPIATPEEIEKFNADMAALGIKWRIR